MLQVPKTRSKTILVAVPSLPTRKFELKIVVDRIEWNPGLMNELGQKLNERKEKKRVKSPPI